MVASRTCFHRWPNWYPWCLIQDGQWLKTIPNRTEKMMIFPWFPVLMKFLLSWLLATDPPAFDLCNVTSLATTLKAWLNHAFPTMLLSVIGTYWYLIMVHSGQSSLTLDHGVIPSLDLSSPPSFFHLTRMFIVPHRDAKQWRSLRPHWPLIGWSSWVGWLIGTYAHNG